MKISTVVHHYTYQDESWAIQLVNNAYGRVGMMVWTDAATHYIHDMALGCPAEGFMLSLLSDVAARIVVATSGDSPPASTKP